MLVQFVNKLKKYFHQRIGFFFLYFSLHGGLLAVDLAPENAIELAGGPFFFTVTGSSQGVIYGTDTYSVDSSIAMAAVHADIVAEGKFAFVQLTLIGDSRCFRSSLRNGLRSGYSNEICPAYELMRSTEGAALLDAYLSIFGIPVGERFAEGNADNDGFSNLSEFAYSTDPTDGRDFIKVFPENAVLNGGQINTTLGEQLLDLGEDYYVQTVRLPKYPPTGVTLALQSTQNLPNFGDGSTNVRPFGLPVEDGETILQTYYQVETTREAPRGFIRIQITMN